MSAKKAVVFGILLAIVAVWSAVYINGRMTYLDKRRKMEADRAEQKAHAEQLTKEVDEMLQKLRQK